MKKILAIIFVAATLLTMSSCAESGTAAGNSAESNAKENSSNETIIPFEMELVGECRTIEGKYEFYRESVTDVIYVQYRGKVMNAGMGGLTALLDPDTGLPLTYARYYELIEQAEAKE